MYAAKVVKNAKALAAELREKGLKIVSAGTDSHVMVVDLRPYDVTGKAAEIALDSIGITVNKNTIPYDPQPPSVCSGIRFGTPALTTRGMGVDEMIHIAGFIVNALQARGDETKLRSLAADVRALAEKFPLYRHRL